MLPGGDIIAGSPSGLREPPMTPEQHRRIIDLLSEHHCMALATLRADGFPQTTTVSYVHDGLVIYFGCSKRSQKAHNLSRDSRISAAINRAYDDWNRIRGLSFGGTAEPLTEFDDVVRASERFIARFPQAAGFALEDMLGTIFYRVKPTAISVIDYTQGFGHSELVLLA